MGSVLISVSTRILVTVTVRSAVTAVSSAGLTASDSANATPSASSTSPTVAPVVVSSTAGSLPTANVTGFGVMISTTAPIEEARRRVEPRWPRPHRGCQRLQRIAYRQLRRGVQLLGPVDDDGDRPGEAHDDRITLRQFGIGGRFDQVVIAHNDLGLGQELADRLRPGLDRAGFTVDGQLDRDRAGHVVDRTGDEGQYDQHAPGATTRSWYAHGRRRLAARSLQHQAGTTGRSSPA